MVIKDLTNEQINEIVTHFANLCDKNRALDDYHVGDYVIIRTYSAGVWFGVLARKACDEVVLINARRMWQWWAAESISLSAVAIHGIKREYSKIAEAVPSVWLQAIEIIPCSCKAIESIRDCERVEAE